MPDDLIAGVHAAGSPTKLLRVRSRLCEGVWIKHFTSRADKACAGVITAILLGMACFCKLQRISGFDLGCSANSECADLFTACFSGEAYFELFVIWNAEVRWATVRFAKSIAASFVRLSQVATVVGVIREAMAASPKCAGFNAAFLIPVADEIKVTRFWVPAVAAVVLVAITCLLLRSVCSFDG